MVMVIAGEYMALSVGSVHRLQNAGNTNRGHYLINSRLGAKVVNFDLVQANTSTT